MKKKRIRRPSFASMPRRKEPDCERLPRSKAPRSRPSNRVSRIKNREGKVRFRSKELPGLTLSAKHKMLGSVKYKPD